MEFYAMNEKNAQLLSELIRMRSVSSEIENVNRVTERIYQEVSAAGLYCRVEDFNGRKCLYAATVEDKQPDYLLNAHVDVVPADNEAMFEPRIEDGYIYARGTSDCLGACVCLIETLRRAKGKNVSCGAIFSADEEIGGFTTGGMLDLGYGAKKAVVIIDASWGRVVYAQKGVMVAKLTAVSSSGGGHSSAPWAFENPVEMLMEDYLQIRSKWDHPTADDQWKNSISPTMISGGFVHNQIPNEASLIMNIRFIDTAEAEKIEKLIRENTRCNVEVTIDCQPVVADPDQEEIVRLRQIMSDYMQKDVPLCRMNGATDARYFKNLNVPVAILGLDGLGAHAPKEFLRLGSIDEMADMMEKFIGA